MLRWLISQGPRDRGRNPETDHVRGDAVPHRAAVRSPSNPHSPRAWHDVRDGGLRVIDGDGDLVNLGGAEPSPRDDVRDLARAVRLLLSTLDAADLGHCYAACEAREVLRRVIN